MSDRSDRMCVLLPCSGDQRWAVPQSCLAEILTVPAGEGVPPDFVEWRGTEIPVLDIGAVGDVPWQNHRSGTGLIAVVVGIRGMGVDFWGLALRGGNLSVRKVEDRDCEDLPEAVLDHSLAAFSLDGVVYQVPDLTAWQGLAAQAASPAALPA